MKYLSRFSVVCAVAVLGAQMFGVAGYAQSNTWVTKTPLPSPRSDLAVGAIGGKLYVVGGFSLQSGFLDQTLAYEPATGSWQALAPMPTPRADASSAVAGGTLYVIGGYNGSLGGALSSVEAYNPATGSWTTRAPMPAPRYQAVAGVIDSVIYVAGGFGGGPEVSTLQAYDTRTDTWTVKAPMPTARYGAAGCAIGGIFYVAGGARTGPGSPISNTYNLLEAYDPKADSWSTKPGMPYPRNWVTSAVLGGMLYVAGGFTYPGGDVVVAYDPNGESWQIKPSLPTPRYLAGAGVVNDVLYVVGGLRLGEHNAITPVAVNEAFSPFLMVSIDIKPGDPTNTINPASRGVVPVAILGSATFDPMTVDPASVTLAGAHVAIRGRGVPMTGVADVNSDGYPDLVLFFRTQDLTALQTAVGTSPLQQTEAVLYGTTYSGQRIRGSDRVRIIPPSQASGGLHTLPPSRRR